MQNLNINDSLYQKKSRRFGWDTVVLCLLLVLAISWNVVIRTYELCVIDGLSMYPTLNHEDLVLINEQSSYEYGDIIVFYLPEKPTKAEEEANPDKYKRLIKRVIATEGDTVLFILNPADSQKPYSQQRVQLFIRRAGGSELMLIEEDYIKEVMVNIDRIFTAFPLNSEITIAEDCLFVMGDNRNNSNDGRSLGQIKIADVCGAVKFHALKDTIYEKIINFLYSNYTAAEE